MRLQDIAALKGDISQISLRQNDDGQWEVGIFLGESVSQEHKITKFHNRSEPRTWKSLDKAVRTLETTLNQRLPEIQIPFNIRASSNHEPEGHQGGNT